MQMANDWMDENGAWPPNTNINKLACARARHIATVASAFTEPGPVPKSNRRRQTDKRKKNKINKVSSVQTNKTTEKSSHSFKLFITIYVCLRMVKTIVLCVYGLCEHTIMGIGTAPQHIHVTKQHHQTRQPAKMTTDITDKITRTHT